jgi:hypothetical protein
MYCARRGSDSHWLVNLNWSSVILVRRLFTLLPLVVFPIALLGLALDVLFLLLCGVLLYQMRFHHLAVPNLSLAQISLPFCICLLC